MSTYVGGERSGEPYENIGAHLINDLSSKTAVSEAARAYRRTLRNPELGEDSEIAMKAREVYKDLKTEALETKHLENSEEVVESILQGFEKEYSVSEEEFKE